MEKKKRNSEERDSENALNPPSLLPRGRKFRYSNSLKSEHYLQSISVGIEKVFVSKDENVSIGLC